MQAVRTAKRLSILTNRQGVTRQRPSRSWLICRHARHTPSVTELLYIIRIGDSSSVRSLEVVADVRFRRFVHISTDNSWRKGLQTRRTNSERTSCEKGKKKEADVWRSGRVEIIGLRDRHVNEAVLPMLAVKMPQRLQRLQAIPHSTPVNKCLSGDAPSWRPHAWEAVGQ